MNRLAGKNMAQFSSKPEKVLAFGLSILLLVVISARLSGVFNHGVMFLTTIGRSHSPAVELFGDAAILLLMGGAEATALLARSALIRAQLQCWAVWCFLLACAFLTRSWFLGPRIAVALAVAIGILALYSIILLFKPQYSLEATTFAKFSY
jgi:hypothetical protein